jgi:SOS-response transcriptional repressor LexA
MPFTTAIFNQSNSLSKLDLNKFLINNPNSSYIMQCDILAEDFLKKQFIIVDRSITPKNNDLTVVIYKSKFLIRKIYINNNTYKYLHPQTNIALLLSATDEISIFGVVISVISKLINYH